MIKGSKGICLGLLFLLLANVFSLSLVSAGDDLVIGGAIKVKGIKVDSNIVNDNVDDDKTEEKSVEENKEVTRSSGSGGSGSSSRSKVSSDFNIKTKIDSEVVRKNVDDVKPVREIVVKKSVDIEDFVESSSFRKEEVDEELEISREVPEIEGKSFNFPPTIYQGTDKSVKFFLIERKNLNVESYEVESKISGRVIVLGESPNNNFELRGENIDNLQIFYDKEQVGKASFDVETSVLELSVNDELMSFEIEVFERTAFRENLQTVPAKEFIGDVDEIVLEDSIIEKKVEEESSLNLLENVGDGSFRPRFWGWFKAKILGFG